jgi:hypothetical protein
MDALGRVFNVLTIADDVYVPLRNYGGVTFVCHLAAGDTYTLTEAQDAAGTGAAVLTTITRFHYSATVGSVWVAVSQAAASTMVTTSAQDVSVLTVNAAELSDGFDYVKLASTSTGLVTAILHDLHSQRTPANLPALV